MERDPSAASSPPSPWQNPPNFLSDAILPRLSYPDHARFASVCRGWRSIQKSHRLHHGPMLPLPWLVVTKRPNNLDASPSIYRPFERRFYRSHPILSRLRPSGRPRHLDVLAASNCCVLILSIQDRSPLPARASLILVDIVTGHETKLPFRHELSEDLLENLYATMSESSSSSSSSSSAAPDKILVRVSDKRLSLFRRGGGDGWKKSSLRCPYGIDDIIYCKGKFYCRCASQGILVADPFPETPTVTFVRMRLLVPWPRPRVRGGHCYESLAECNGELLLVRESTYGLDGNNELVIYRIDISRKEYVWVKNIGDWMLLLNSTYSMSLLASEVGGEKNCVYSNLIQHRELWGTFDLENGREKVLDKANCIQYGADDNSPLYAYCWVVPR